MNMLQSVSNQSFTKKFVLTALLLTSWIGPLVPLAHAASSDTSLLKTWVAGKNDVKTEQYEIPVMEEEKKPVKTMKLDITAYSSAVDECDDSPFLTADGSVVRDGIVATNVLPFGTKLRIPSHFGDKVFEVRDRMNPRYSYRMDLWVENKQVARQWGIKRNITVEIIEMGNGKKSWDQWKGRMKEMQMVGKYGPTALKEDA